MVISTIHGSESADVITGNNAGVNTALFTEVNLSAFEQIHNGAYDVGSGISMASGAVAPHFTHLMNVVDSLGVAHSLTMGFLHTGVNQWQVEVFATNPAELSSILPGTPLTHGIVEFPKALARVDDPGMEDMVIFSWNNGSDPVNLDVNLNLVQSGAPSLVLDSSVENVVVSGLDRIYGFGGNDVISGMGGADFIDGGEGNDALTGDAGNDVIYGRPGDDLIFGNEGRDILFGHRDNDTMQGNQGHDFLHGGFGNDVIYGGKGDDWLRGWDGEDILSGDLGNDRLRGGNGIDTLTGGEGADVFAYFTFAESTAEATDVVTDFKIGVDKIYLSELPYFGINQEVGVTGTTVQVVGQDGVLEVFLAGVTETLSDTDFI